jgi:GNAT superfamily N-acetyltransferase
LESAEGHACLEYAQAHARVLPASGAAWTRCAGAYVVFDGPESPITQTFGLGIFEDLTPATLDEIEHFFTQRGAPVFHEVSPYAGIKVLDLLSERGYRPIELSNVLCKEVEDPPAAVASPVTVRLVQPEQTSLWNDVSTQGWAAEHPEYADFFRDHGAISAARQHCFCFLAEYAGTPAAAGALSIHDAVALFAGSSTVPEFRRRGLQSALLYERMRYARQHGCTMAMMVAEPGSNSHRNAERQGFHVAYTRTKWKLHR